jgi:hypothetical protein
LKTVTLLQQQMNDLMEIYDVSQPFVSAIKAAAALLIPGLSPLSRVPAGSLDAGQMERIGSILKKAGITE